MEYLLLSAKLQDCYNESTVAAEDDLCIYCPVIGQACVARYDDKYWYRAQIIGKGVFSLNKCLRVLRISVIS